MTTVGEPERTLWAKNRIKWYSKLADDATHDSVKVLFLVAMSEAVVRLKEDKFEENSFTKEYVKLFFDKLSKEDKYTLENSFTKETETGLYKKSLEDVIDILYDVRNSVAHGKSHYDFQFSMGEDHFNPNMSVSGKRKELDRLSYDECTLDYKDFKNLMLNTAKNWL